MAALFFDGERLVTHHIIMWVGPTDNSDMRWGIHDSDGGVEYFTRKSEAIAKLASYKTDEDLEERMLLDEWEPDRGWREDFHSDG